MKEKVGIKAGKLELIPITANIKIGDVDKKFPDECVSQDDLEWVETSLSEYETIFIVCNLTDQRVLGNVMCKTDASKQATIELFFRNLETLPAKDFCNVVYYASQWEFKFAGKNKAFLLNNDFDSELINRLRLLEFKKSKREGYLERNTPDNDPTVAIISVLNGL